MTIRTIRTIRNTAKYGRTLRNKDWETANFAGVMFSLAKFKNDLSVTRGYKLNSRSRELDIRIIRTSGAASSANFLNHAIAHIFQKHNIVELKNPKEALNINVFWKGISYAAQYKSDGKDDATGETGVNVKPMSDITLTFLRVVKPTELLKYIANHGFTVEKSQDFAGIYYVRGIPELRIQIVVGSELEGDEFIALRVQKENASEEDIRKFIMTCDEFREETDRDMAANILDVSYENNKAAYKNILGEDERMSQILEELLNDRLEIRTRASFDKGREKGRAEGRAEGRTEERHNLLTKLQENGMLTAEQAATAMNWNF